MIQFHRKQRFKLLLWERNKPVLLHTLSTGAPSHRVTHTHTLSSTTDIMSVTNMLQLTLIQDLILNLILDLIQDLILDPTLKSNKEDTKCAPRETAAIKREVVVRFQSKSLTVNMFQYLHVKAVVRLRVRTRLLLRQVSLTVRPLIS